MILTDILRVSLMHPFVFIRTSKIWPRIGINPVLFTSFCFKTIDHWSSCSYEIVHKKNRVKTHQCVYYFEFTWIDSPTFIQHRFGVLSIIAVLGNWMKCFFHLFYYSWWFSLCLPHHNTFSFFYTGCPRKLVTLLT